MMERPCVTLREAFAAGKPNGDVRQDEHTLRALVGAGTNLAGIRVPLSRTGGRVALQHCPEDIYNRCFGCIQELGGSAVVIIESMRPASQIAEPLIADR